MKSNTKMYLYGASGHAKVIIDILKATGMEVNALFDDNPEILNLYGKKVSGKYLGQSLEAPIIISIGDNAIRAKIANSIKTDFGTAIHPGAIISSSVQIQEGTVVMQGVVVQADTQIGKHVIVNTKASVDHDCLIGDYAHISPGAILCGGVQVGEGTHVGAGAVVLPLVKIGKWCKIGAGAVVIKDVPDGVIAVGNPARCKPAI